MNTNKKILLTGATGLIGKELIKPLKEKGFELYALTIDKSNLYSPAVFLPCNVFDMLEVQKKCEEIKADYLLNMAWCTTGDYKYSPLNYEFFNAGVNLLNNFIKNGGKRAVFIGSYFEYKCTKSMPLKENDSLNTARMDYTFYKDLLHQVGNYICGRNNISFSYARIFNVYGRHENKTRLTGMLIDKLSKNEEVIIRNGNLLRDYMYAKDIANSLVYLLDSNVEGSVNICTGQAISIKDFALQIAKKMGKEHLLIFGNEPSLEPPLIVGDNTRLTKEVGYKIEYDLEKAIEDILNTTDEFLE